MALTNEDVAKILQIVDESNYDEVHIEVGDLKVHLRKGAAAEVPRDSWTSASEAAAPAAPVPKEEKKSVADEPIAEGLIAVRAPMMGTFYRAPSPGEKPFVEVGDRVETDSTVCLVEVMKLFNSVKAGVSGTVKRIPVQNGSTVEYGQVLLLIEREAVPA